MMALVLLVIVVLFYWKVTLTRQYDWGWGPDFATQVMPWFNEQARQWHAGEFPLWDPTMRGGQPFLGQAQPGAAYPLNWLLFLLPLGPEGDVRPGYLQGYFIAIHWMAALFAYLLARRLGCSRPASVLTGIVFSFSGFLGAKNWPQMINGAVWTPLCFWFLTRGPRPWTDAAVSGVALGMSWLSGHHQIPLFVTFAAAGVWIWRCAAGSGAIRHAACAAVIAGCVAAPQILPAREYGKLAKRWAGAGDGLRWDQPVPSYVHERYANSPLSLLHVAIPGGLHEVNPFAGVTAVTLALLGLTAWRLPGTRELAAIAMAGWIYSLGPATWLHGLFYALVPMAEKARTPAAASHLLCFGVAMLAARGVDHVRAGASEWVRRASGALAAGGAVLAVSIYVVRPEGQDPRVGLAMLVAWLLAAALCWRHPAMPAALCGIALIELSGHTLSLVTGRDHAGTARWTQAMHSHPEIARFLRAQPGPFRVLRSGDDVYQNWPAWRGLHTPAGYLASISENYAGWPTYTVSGRRLMNTRFRITEGQPEPHERTVFEAAGGPRVVEDPLAFPRAWVVHQAKQASRAEVDAMVHSRVNDLRDVALTSGPAPALAACGSKGEVAIDAYLGGRVSMRAHMPCLGLVVLADTWLPGWRAAVDASPTPVIEVDNALRAVLVPAGEHRIEMRYRPLSVYVGALLAVAGLAASALIVFRSRTTS